MIEPHQTVGALSRAPVIRAPVGSCDCHVHIIGSQGRYPLSELRAYTPSEASPQQYEQVLSALGMERIVVVQASVYGTDNRCTLDAVRHFGTQRCRGVVVVDSSITRTELQRMHDAGVRGARVNLVAPGGPRVDRLMDLARGIAELGWHLQVYLHGEVLQHLAPLLGELPVHIVIDHMGNIPAAWGVRHPSVTALRRLLDNGRTWIKLCGYRLSGTGYPYSDVGELATTLVHAAPQRCVWGTDWPHPAFAGMPPDDGELLDALMQWVPTAALQRTVLVDNPARLYGFAS